METYNPATNAWTLVAPLNVAKSFSFIATVGSEIVAAAGSVGTGPTTDNEVYDPTSNAWTNKRSAHLARYGGCMGSIGGSLYAAGGLKFVPFRSAAKELYAYNVAADRWTKLARLPSPMIAPASATMNGQLYCIGGSPASVSLRFPKRFRYISHRRHRYSLRRPRANAAAFWLFEAPCHGVTATPVTNGPS